MRLNRIRPASGSKKVPRRVGRGKSAGQGKTCGRGTKGQHSRSGGYHKVGFEGGQMPLQRRLPKVGFKSLGAAFNAEVRLGALAAVVGDVIDPEVLKRARLVSRRAKRVRLIATGSIDRPLTVKGIHVTKGARAAIEAAGGKIED